MWEALCIVAIAGFLFGAGYLAGRRSAAEQRQGRHRYDRELTSQLHAAQFLGSALSL